MKVEIQSNRGVKSMKEVRTAFILILTLVITIFMHMNPLSVAAYQSNGQCSITIFSIQNSDGNYAAASGDCSGHVQGYHSEGSSYILVDGVNMGVMGSGTSVYIPQKEQGYYDLIIHTVFEDETQIDKEEQKIDEELITMSMVQEEKEEVLNALASDPEVQEEKAAPNKTQEETNKPIPTEDEEKEPLPSDEELQQVTQTETELAEGKSVTSKEEPQQTMTVQKNPIIEEEPETIKVEAPKIEAKEESLPLQEEVKEPERSINITAGEVAMLTTTTPSKTPLFISGFGGIIIAIGAYLYALQWREIQ